MVEKRLYTIIATLGAIFIYLFFVYLLVDFVKNSEKIMQDFGYNVDDAIVVEIAAPENEKPVEKEIEKPKPTPKPIPVVKPIVTPPKPIVKSEPIPEPVKEVKEEPVQKEKESRDKVAKTAKDLFSTVRTDKFDKVMDERRKQDASRASRLKKQKAEQERKKTQERKKRKAREKALAEARAAMEDIDRSSAASHKKSGTEDSFWSPVANRIQALWNRTIQTQNGLSADVRITIDSEGRLRYRIKRLSNNSLFDKKLQIFLDNLEYENFPKYRRGGSTSKVLYLEDREDL